MSHYISSFLSVLKLEVDISSPSKEGVLGSIFLRLKLKMSVLTEVRRFYQNVDKQRKGFVPKCRQAIYICYRLLEKN